MTFAVGKKVICESATLEVLTFIFSFGLIKFEFEFYLIIFAAGVFKHTYIYLFKCKLLFCILIVSICKDFKVKMAPLEP